MRENRSAYEQALASLPRPRRRQQTLDEDDRARSAGRLPRARRANGVSAPGLRRWRDRYGTRGQGGWHGHDPEHRVHLYDRGRGGGWGSAVVPALRLLRPRSHEVSRRARGGMRHGRDRAHRGRSSARPARARSAQSLSSARGSSARQRALVRQHSHAHRAWRARAGDEFRERYRRRAQLARRRLAPLDHAAPGAPQGYRSRRRRGARRSITERPASSSRITAAASSIPRSRRSARCRRSSTRSRAAWKCCWTAAFAAAPM